MIEAERVSKGFRSGRGHLQALSDVSFRVEGGRAVAIVGKSGSGKSTLLNCLGGLETPDEGRITCFGTNIHTLSSRELSRFQRRSTGFVFQRSNLLSYLTVFENISFPLTLNGIEGRRRKARVEELLDRIGLAGAGSALPHELSGGEMQRVSVARAIAHAPRVLLADEPTASLDTATALSIIELIVEMARENGSTTLISTHDLEILRLVDSSIRLHDGRIVS